MTPHATQRLGFLITSLQGGGAERVVSNLCRALEGCERNLLLFENDVGYPFDGNIHIVDVPVLADTPWLRRMWGMIRGLAQLHSARQSLSLDTCISFLTWPNLFNILSKNGERTIISVRSNPSRSIRGPLTPVLKTAMRFLYPKADHVVAISEHVRRDLIEQFGVHASNITTIYNPIRLDEVTDQANRPLPAALKSLPSHPTVISMGRLAMPKGHWHLVRAFHRLHRGIPDSRLLLVGEGPYRDYLVDLARQLGLSVWVRGEPAEAAALDHDVLFWGFADNPFPILKNCDVFAFPSLWEGLGNVLIESLACNVPVASADCHSGPREILAPSTPCDARTTRPEWADYGVLLPVCDGNRYDHTAPLTDEENTWAAVLADLLEDPGLRHRYARRGPRRAADFELQHITAQWRRLLENHPGAAPG